MKTFRRWLRQPVKAVDRARLGLPGGPFQVARYRGPLPKRQRPWTPRNVEKGHSKERVGFHPPVVSAAEFLRPTYRCASVITSEPASVSSPRTAQAQAGTGAQRQVVTARPHGPPSAAGLSRLREWLLPPCELWRRASSAWSNTGSRWPPAGFGAKLRRGLSLFSRPLMV